MAESEETRAARQRWRSERSKLLGTIDRLERQRQEEDRASRRSIERLLDEVGELRESLKAARRRCARLAGALIRSRRPRG